jgi:hypothetical protein
MYNDNYVAVSWNSDKYNADQWVNHLNKLPMYEVKDADFIVADVNVNKDETFIAYVKLDNKYLEMYVVEDFGGLTDQLTFIHLNNKKFVKS